MTVENNRIPFHDIRTIFFDYDGTLHNSVRIYGPSFRRAYAILVDEGLAEPRDWTDREISHWLGYNPREMWQVFMPDLDAEIRNKCSQIIGEEMRKRTDGGQAALYEGALETLRYLKSGGYRLVFISNCKMSYRDTHRARFGLGAFFEELACSEEYSFIPKYEMLREIKGKYPKEMVIVGDRFQDMEAGMKNGMYTIGCNYGFSREGELKGADLRIEYIRELQEYF